MGLYINAYRDLCQVLANSVELKADFEFQLNGIEKGSIISKLSRLRNGVDDFFEQSFYKSGMALFDELSDECQTESEEDVEGLAVTLENRLADEMPGNLVAPHVDRQGLAFVLNKFSLANKKMQSGETVEVFTSEADKPHSINTSWSFTGDAAKMFLGKTEIFEGRDKLFAMIQVNEGNSVWTFKSPATQQKFPAKITHKEWLERYQGGLIPAIGPFDMLDAELSYVIYTPPEGKGRVQIRNAKINNVLGVLRGGNSDKQNVLGL
ncbi:hypothetical protein [Pseudomonas sp. 58 R 3]|nr:hypothetical protein [Pseudomonas sp. 58 R 3]